MEFHIKPQPLDKALVEFSVASRSQVVADGKLTARAHSPGVHGRYGMREALERLLGQSGLSIRSQENNTFILQKTSDPQTNMPVDGTLLPRVTVTAKHGNDSMDPFNPDYTRENASVGTKTETSLLQTPASVSIITRKQIEDRQAWTPEEALKYTAGVNSPSGGGRSPFDQAFNIRGFSTGEAGDLGGFYYRDGFRMSGIPIAMGNVERIELLKGPASILYGRTEPGGLINVIYKKPLSTPYYSLEQQFGSYDFYRTNVDATGPLTSDGSLAYRATLQAVESGSFTRYLENNFLSLSPSLTWKPSEQTRLDFQFDYMHNEFTYPQGIPVVGGRIADVPAHRLLDLYKPKDPDGKADNYLASVALEHVFNEDWKLRWNNLYANQSLEWIRGGRPTVSSIDPATGVASNATVIAEPDDDRYWWFTTLNLIGNIDLVGVRNKVLLGFDYMNERFDGPQFFKSYNISYNIYRPSNLLIPRPSRQEAIAQADFFQQSNDWYGIYIQDQIDVNDQFHLILGGRYDNAENYSGFSRQDAKNPSREEGLNPRYGIVYQPLPWASVYYQYLESFGASNGRASDGSSFSPQTAQQHEGGLKAEFFGGALNSSLAFFHLTKQNLLTTDPDFPERQRAIGEARSQGVEFEAIGRLTENLNLIATYTYTDTRITEDNDGNQGNQLPNVPKSSGSAWTVYNVTDRFRLGAGVYVTGRREGDAANTYQIPGYVRLDAMASYKWQVGRSPLTAQININNLLDKDYFTNSNGSLAVLPGAPITVLGSLRLEY